MDETEQPLTDDEIWGKIAGADAVERVDLMLELTERAADVDQHDRVVVLAQGTIDVARTVGRTEAQARATFLAAEAQSEQGLTEEALSGYRQASDLYRSLVDEESVADCHFRAGWTLSAAGRVEEALTEWTTAQHLAAQIPGGEEGLGKTALARAGALEQLGQPNEALDALSQAREAFRRHGDPTRTSWADDRAAGLLLSLGRTGEAVTWLERCLAVAQADGEPHALAYARIRLAGALRADGRPGAGLTQATKARRGFREVKDYRGMAGCDREVAFCRADLGDLDRALDRLRRSRALYDAIGDDAMVRAVDLNTAVVLWGRHERDESVAVARRALSAAQDAGDDAAATSVAVRLADSLVDLGHLDQAAEVLGSVSPPSDSAGLYERGRWLAVTASVHAATGDLAAAERLATEGLELVADTTFAAVRALLHAARSEARRTCDPAGSEADRARAVAFSLEAQNLERAVALSQPFLSAT